MPRRQQVPGGLSRLILRFSLRHRNPGQGLKSGGSGGSSRISVMVTRRLAAM